MTYFFAGYAKKTTGYARSHFLPNFCDIILIKKATLILGL